jgi:transposase InsO family protein
MGTKSRDWESIGNYVAQIKAENLTYVEGAKRFGLSVSDIYEYNKRFKNDKHRSIGKVKNWKKIGDSVSRISELGLKYTDGAKEFGLDVSEIYRYNRRQKEKKANASVENRDFAMECSECADEIKAGVAGTDTDTDTDAGSDAGAVAVGVDAGSDVVSGTLGLPAEVEELIVDYRRKNPGHGFKRIVDHLKSRYFVVVERKKVREVLKLHGLNGSGDSSFDKPDCDKRVKGVRRFEAPYPRDLYQMDITYVYLANNAIYYLVIIIDDYSRFCVASELRRDQRGLSMIEVLHRGTQRYGKPAKLLTDQGSSFYSWSREQTLFARYLDDMKIEHIVADPHSPQTLGKVERLNQTVQRELLNKSHFSGYEDACRSIESYFHHYNYERPHQGIAGAIPASRFFGIIGETCRIESELCSHGLDFSRGYLVFKMHEHTISIVCRADGLQVFLDGHLLKYSQQGEGASDEDN